MAEMVSDYNLQTLNTVQLTHHINATIDIGGAMFILGTRGIGKTFIAKQCIKDAGLNCINFSLSTFDRADFIGYPNFFAAKEKEKKNQYVDYILPRIYEALLEDRDKKSVVLFDEIDKAEREIFAPILEFIQFYTLNSKKLENLQAIICTGNHATEGGTKPPSPVLDRVEKYVVEVRPKDWLDWAASKEGDIHPSVISFINDNLDCLQGDTDLGEMYANESPRAWHNASKVIQFGEKNKWHNAMIWEKVAGYVGKKSGIKFRAYFENYKEFLPLVDSILKGEKVKEFGALEETKKWVVCMTAANRVAKLLDGMSKKDIEQKHIPKQVGIIGQWLRSIDEEMALLAIRCGLTYKRMVPLKLEDNEHFGPLLDALVKRTRGEVA